MHEVSLVAELVDRCVQLAGRQAAPEPVTAVRVRYATTIPADVLHQAFTTLTADTPLAGARLEAQPFDVRLDCATCDFTGPLGHDDVAGSMAVCPRCGGVTPLRHPVELELLELVGDRQARSPVDGR
jgi:Zn finger protein HypA/HybF involved in hydrogenase expression